MSDPARARMTSDEFLAWAIGREGGERYELAAGEVVAMAPERAAHTRVKGRIFRRLSEAIEAAGLPCEAYVDGMGIEVDANTLYEPDVMVRCGAMLSG
jgi:Uma2 family endonuclease